MGQKSWWFTVCAVVLLVASGCTPPPQPNADLMGQVELEGRAPDQHGGATVLLLGTEHRVSTRPDGSFRFLNLPAGVYDLQVQHPDYHTSQNKAVALSAGSLMRIETIYLRTKTLVPHEGPLRGEVLLQDRNSHEGTLVMLLGTAFMAVTNDQGHFHFPLVPPGDYTLRASHTGYLESATVAVAIVTGAEPLEISPLVLEPAPPSASPAPSALTGIIEGQIVLEGEPNAAGVLVSVTGSQLIARTDAEGRFKLPEVSPGTYTVNFDYKNYQPTHTLSVQVEAGQTVPLPLVLLAQPQTRQAAGQPSVSGYSVRGVVLLESAEQLAGTQVTINGLALMTTTDTNGEYLFTDVPAGIHTISASHPDYQSGTVQHIVGEGETELASAIYLQRLSPLVQQGSLIGKATLEGEYVHVGIILFLEGIRVMAMTDQQGHYVFNDVPAGIYRLYAQKEGYEPVEAEVVIEPDTDNLAPELVLSPYLQWVEVINTKPVLNERHVTVADSLLVTIQFSEPMGGDTVKDNVQIQPDVTHAMYFNNEHAASRLDTLVIELRRAAPTPLRFKTRYDITVFPGALSLDGNTLEVPYTLSFVTAGPMIVGSYPDTERNRIVMTPKTYLYVEFNTRIDYSSFVSALEFWPVPFSKPLVHPEPLPGGQRMNIEVSLEENRKYRMRVKNNVRSTYGERIENVPYEIHFTSGSISELPMWDSPLDGRLLPGMGPGDRETRTRRRF